MRIARSLSLAALLAVVLAYAMPAPARVSLSEARQRLKAEEVAAAAHRKAAEAAAQQAQTASERHAALVQQEVAEATSLRQFEAATAAHAQTLAGLRTAQEQAKAERAADAAALEPLIPLMTRLSLYPASTFLAAQSDSTALAPGDAVKGALIMQGLTRAITNRARALRRAETRLTALTASEVAAQAAVTASVARQEVHEQALTADIDAVEQTETNANQSAAAERKAETAASDSAHTLGGVIERLQEEERRREVDIRRAARRARPQTQQAAARIPLGEAATSSSAGIDPVAGHLVKRFGSSTLAGPATGDTFAAAPGASVITPVAGTVVFARPFRAYGKLLILDCGHGYNFVFAGFDQFDVRLGAHIAAGQPVGRMPGYQAARPGRQPDLYVELRHDGTAIDPATRFAHGLPGG